MEIEKVIRIVILLVVVVQFGVSVAARILTPNADIHLPWVTAAFCLFYGAARSTSASDGTTDEPQAIFKIKSSNPHGARFRLSYRPANGDPKIDARRKPEAATSGFRFFRIFAVPCPTPCT